MRGSLGVLSSLATCSDVSCASARATPPHANKPINRVLIGPSQRPPQRNLWHGILDPRGGVADARIPRRRDEGAGGGCSRAGERNGMGRSADKKRAARSREEPSERLSHRYFEALRS